MYTTETMNNGDEMYVALDGTLFATMEEAEAHDHQLYLEDDDLSFYGSAHCPE